YRAGERPFDTSLSLWRLAGKQRRSGVGGKVRKIRKATPLELGAQSLGRHVDRRPGPARECDDERTAGRKHSVELIEERDHVAEPDEVERGVTVWELRRIGDLETNPVAQVVVKVLARLLDHPLGDVSAGHLRPREATRDQERRTSGPGA